MLLIRSLGYSRNKADRILPHFAVLAFCLLVFERRSFVSGNDVPSKGAFQLNSENINKILESNELVFINFYAEWCHFSKMLQPNFEKAADLILQEYGPNNGIVVMAKLDCDQEQGIASTYHITKYPTLKIIRNGQPLKKEYRGARTAEAFVEFIKEQLKNPIKEFQNLKDLTTLDDKKRMIIGYFTSNDTVEYRFFKKIAISFKDDCQFYVGFGDASREMHPPGVSILVFRPDKAVSNEKDETFMGNVTDFDQMKMWVQEKCVPFVREITFENAEELTEEGLPFLILFHDPKDTDSIKQFKDVVSTTLADKKQSINILTADGHKFAHPLHHLGKSSDDLPLIAIDSFRHMYLFPNFQDMYKPGKLEGFINDLHSGKLHREFHYGPETPSGETEKLPTTPPESTFKKLAPSKNRYTLLRDEL